MQCAGQGADISSGKVIIRPAQPGVLCLQGWVEKREYPETKNPWLVRMGMMTLPLEISAPRPAHCIHWRVGTEGWIPAYWKKDGMNSVASNCLIKLPHQTVSSKCLNHKNVSSKYFIKVSHQNVSSKCLINMSHQNISLKCLIKMSHQNVSSKCLIKIIHQTVSSKCIIKMAHQNISSKCLIKMVHQNVS